MAAPNFVPTPQLAGVSGASGVFVEDSANTTVGLLQLQCATMR
jgi:hypothetical protein